MGAPQRAASAPRLFDERMFAKYANPSSFEGTELTITEYPNPVLRAKNAEIAEFDDQLAKLCSDMFSIMYAASGVGIAAPQVGLNLKLFVYNLTPRAPGALRKMGEVAVVNPRIVEYCQPAGIGVEIEGCLSSRSECCSGHIARAEELQVEYQDERGRSRSKKLRGFEARVFQHEFDHINGVLHIDRQAAADRARIQPFLDVLIEQHGPGGDEGLEPDPAVLEALPSSVGAAATAAARAAAPAAASAATAPAAAPAASGGGGGGFGGFGSGGKSTAAKKSGKSKKKKR